MTYRDLPENWTELPITTPGLAADAVDLFLGLNERLSDSILFLLVDEENRIVPPPIVISDVPWHCEKDRRSHVFRTLQQVPIPRVIVAISSARPIIRLLAQVWLEVAQRELAKHNIELVGFFSASPRGVTELPLRLVEAA